MDVRSHGGQAESTRCRAHDWLLSLFYLGIKTAPSRDSQLLFRGESGLSPIDVNDSVCHSSFMSYSAGTPFTDPGSSSFFDSIRRSGWFRGEDRLVGGVCAGMSARTGWNLAFVRAMAIVLGLLCSILILPAYGLAWAFLPEYRDGRIHCEQLIRFGTFDVGFAGALVTTLVGLASSAAVPWIYPLVILGAIILPIMAIAGAVQYTRNHQKGALPHVPPSSYVPASAPRPVSAPTPSPATGTPNNPWTVPPAQRPASPSVPMPANLAITGLIVLALAAACALVVQEGLGGVDAVRVFVVLTASVLVGLGIVLAFTAFRGRRAPWLICLSVLVAVCSPLVLAVGYTEYEQEQYLQTLESEEPGMAEADTAVTYDWTATQLSDTGSITLDLSQAPADALKTIRLDDIGGDVTIVMRQNQPVGFHLYSSVGLIRSDYWLDAQGGRVSSPWIPEVQFVSEELAFRNDFWSPQHGINLEITNVYGSVTIIESAPADISGDTIQSGDLSQSGAQSGDTAQSSSRSNG